MRLCNDNLWCGQKNSCQPHPLAFKRDVSAIYQRQPGERCVSVGFGAGEDKKYVKNINPAIRKEIQDAETGEK